MTSSDLFKLGNPRKVQDCLRSFIDQQALDAIEAEVHRNCRQLFRLSLYHYNFAVALESSDWRQKVSRLYYSSYAASRMTRLYVSGHYSTDSKDHQKITELPDDFPNIGRFSNQLSMLREDRNTCDYDHASRLSDLVLSVVEAEALVTDFLGKTKRYLRARGLDIRGGP